jgi:hypothetical protein
MSLGTLGIQSERSHDTGDLRYRQRELLRQWRSFLAFYVAASVKLGLQHSNTPKSHPGSIARPHTLFDALPLPFRMTKAARNTKRDPPGNASLDQLVDSVHLIVQSGNGFPALRPGSR